MPLKPDDLARTRDPTRLAAEYLMTCQGDDGLFSAERGSREGDSVPGPEHDDAITGLAVLVLLDVAEPAGDERAAKSARLALDAVARRARPDGSLSADAEGHALLTWALAAGYEHTGTEAWKPAVKPAVLRLLATAREEGGWRGGKDDVEADLLLSMWAIGALVEASNLSVTVAANADIEDAVDAASVWATGFPADRVSGLSPGARAAWGILCRRAGERVEPVHPTAAIHPSPAGGEPYCDPVAILWGTVDLFLAGDLPAWRKWEGGAVLPALARQREQDPGAGSWTPSDERSRRYGRAYATAVQTFGWQVVRVPYREPKAR